MSENNEQHQPTLEDRLAAVEAEVAELKADRDYLFPATGTLPRPKE